MYQSGHSSEKLEITTMSLDFKKSLNSARFLGVTTLHLAGNSRYAAESVCPLDSVEEVKTLLTSRKINWSKFSAKCA